MSFVNCWGIGAAPPEVFFMADEAVLSVLLTWTIVLNEWIGPIATEGTCETFYSLSIHLSEAVQLPFFLHSSHLLTSTPTSLS